MGDRTYTVEPFPFARQVAADGLAVASGRHWIHALIEVDATTPRHRLREIKAETGQSLSLTAFIIHCFAKAVDADKHVQACRDWRNRLILFDDVDVFTPVERVVEGQPQVHRTVIRAANRKSVREVQQEVRRAQSEAVAETAVVRHSRWYAAMPALVRRLAYRALTASAHRLKRYAGTALVSSLGMFGSGIGWGIPLPAHTLSVTVGGMASRPAVTGARIEDRECLCLTLTFDHDIVDGAPAARFVQRFKELVERGEGLFEQSASCA